MLVLSDDLSHKGLMIDLLNYYSMNSNDHIIFKIIYAALITSL